MFYIHILKTKVAQFMFIAKKGKSIFLFAIYDADSIILFDVHCRVVAQ